MLRWFDYFMLVLTVGCVLAFVALCVWSLVAAAT